MESIIPFNLARTVMLMHTMRNLKDVVEKACKLNSVQARILCFLDLHGDSFQVGKLAESLGVSPSLATKTIASLEVGKYVNRIDDQTDRRVVYVALTQKGKQTAARLWDAQGQTITKDYHLIVDAQKQNNRERIETPYTPIYQGILAGDRHSIFALTEYYAGLSNACNYHARLHEVSFNAYFILLILYENENESSEISPSDLATFLLLKKTVVSHALSELVSNGYVNCHRSNFDRRKNVVDLTNEGYTLISSVAPSLYDDLLKISFTTANEEAMSKEELDTLAVCADYFNEAMRKSFHP